MIFGLKARGITEADVRRLLAWAIERNERYYRANRGVAAQAPTMLSRLVYLPDPVADSVLIVCADSLQGRASCGSATAAWVGLQQSMGRRSAPRLRQTRPGVWHVWSETWPGTGVGGGDPSIVEVWDPAERLVRMVAI